MDLSEFWKKFIDGTPWLSVLGFSERSSERVGCKDHGVPLGCSPPVPAGLCLFESHGFCSLRAVGGSALPTPSQPATLAPIFPLYPWWGGIPWQAGLPASRLHWEQGLSPSALLTFWANNGCEGVNTIPGLCPLAFPPSSSCDS